MRAEKSRAAIAQIVTIRFAAGAEEEEPGVDWRTAHAESFPVEVGRISREAPELRSGKPGLRPGLLFEAERRISMIKLLVELLLIGRFTVIIVWDRKGRREWPSGIGLVSPVPLLAYSKTRSVLNPISYSPVLPRNPQPSQA